MPVLPNKLTKIVWKKGQIKATIPIERFFLYLKYRLARKKIQDTDFSQFGKLFDEVFEISRKYPISDTYLNSQRFKTLVSKLFKTIFQNL